jgi:26S proteasome regulatory subunit N9
MQVDSDVSNWIQNQSKLFPNFTCYFQKFDKLYDQKYAQINDRLWHELTIELEELTVKVEANSLLLSLYDNFIKHFETKINKISLVRLVSRICKQKNPKDAIEFLTLTAAQLKKDENHQNAFVLISAEIASLKLSTGQLEGCLSEIKDCEKILEKLPYPDPVINASFYKVCCEYYKVTLC